METKKTVLKDYYYYYFGHFRYLIKMNTFIYINIVLHCIAEFRYEYSILYMYIFSWRIMSLDNPDNLSS